MPGFEVVRKDRSVSGGGVCIYLQSNINYQIRNDLCDDRLECVVIEIIRPHSRSFIVSTWYKPPNSPQDISWQFGSLIDKVDSEQKDFYLLGDLNCNLHDGSNHNSSTLTNILDIYGLSQLISESTRITPTSSTLIDLCITSSPEKISKAGVVHWSNSLVFVTLKICYERTGSHRCMQAFEPATGLDGIPFKLLKLSSSIVGSSLAYIFKSCIDTEIFPNEWKIAKVTPLFKKGSKRELGNYRPISVLPLVSKIFEKIIYRQLYDYLQDNSHLNTCQSGFQSMHSTLTALLKTTNNCTYILLNPVSLLWSWHFKDGVYATSFP